MSRADGERPAPPGGAIDRQWGFRTRAVHAGAVPDAASLFALQKFGTIYSRISKPTVAAWEERLASLEDGLYGGTISQLDVTLRRSGVDTVFVPGAKPSAVAAAITEKTKLVFAEVIANPSGEIADITALADVAYSAGAPLVIDATLATPFLCRAIEHGADIVIHSATKFLGGHGTTLGGVVIEAGRFDWGNSRFPVMTAPIPSYGGLTWWGNFQEHGFLTKLRAEQLRDIGPSLSPMAAFLLLQGVETLPLRMAAHVANARTVAFDGVAEQLADVNAAAQASGRTVRFGLNGFLIARDTEAEARETLREIVAKADRPAVEGFRDAVTQAGASTRAAHRRLQAPRGGPAAARIPALPRGSRLFLPPRAAHRPRT